MRARHLARWGIFLVVASLLLGVPTVGLGHGAAGPVPAPAENRGGLRPGCSVCAPQEDSARPRSTQTLLSVAVEPPSVEVPVGERTVLTPSPSCSGGPCPDGLTYAWSARGGLGSLSYTRSNQLIASVPSGGEIPAGIALDTSNGDLYVTNDNVYNPYKASNVSVLSPATESVVANIPVGASPAGIAFDPQDNDLYVANCGSDNLSVISGATDLVVASIAMTLSSCVIGPKMYMNFAPVAYDPADQVIYVSSYASGLVYVVNTSSNTVVDTLDVGGAPYDFAYDPVDQNMYVSETVLSQVAVIDGATNTVLARIPVGAFPSGVAYDAATGEVYVADAGYYVRNPAGFGNITVINATTNSVVDTIFVQGYPWFLAYDPADGEVYETDSNTTVMKVLSDTTNTVVGQIPVSVGTIGGSTDFMDLYDAQLGRLFVTGINYDIVSAIGGATVANTFVAAGSTGTSTLFLNATWNGTTVESPPVPLTVFSSTVPVVQNLSIAPDPARLGDTVELTTSAYGGTGPLTYTYFGLPPGCASSNASSFECRPSTPGLFDVSVFVNDSGHHAASGSADLTVLAPMSQTPPPTTRTPAGFLGLSWAVWEAAGLALAAVVVLGALLVRRRRRARAAPSTAPGAAPTGSKASRPRRWDPDRGLGP